ncbi:MAG: hypothetical protein AYL28_005280 [Candidatus Bathyarchaeota archaeon B23]|nr:MAG: hypothetical protein AYL28_005280 [Candidatus Bathyarchaeota archaeon B23]
MKITYMPAKELIILEMVEYTLQELAEVCALLIEAGRPVVLNWADGVAFHHVPLPFNTKELLRERMRGRIYWASLLYAEMPEYRSVLKVGAREVPVLATPNPLLRRVARWIRERMEEGGP